MGGIRIAVPGYRIDAAEVVDPERPRSGQAATRAFFGVTVRYVDTADAAGRSRAKLLAQGAGIGDEGEGQKPPANLQSTTLTPQVTIGGASDTVSFSGPTPGYISLYQINVQVPATTSGASTLAVSIGGVTSRAVALSVT